MARTFYSVLKFEGRVTTPDRGIARGRRTAQHGGATRSSINPHHMFDAGYRRRDQFHDSPLNLSIALATLSLPVEDNQPPLSTGKQLCQYCNSMPTSLDVLGTATFLLAASGVFMASIAHRYPEQASQIEYIAGAMLVGGLALFGACLKALTG